MIAILIALAAVLILSVVMVTISLNALIWFLLLIIPLIIAHLAAKFYGDREDPPFLWYILTYGGGIACSVWYIVDYFNESMDVGYLPVIIMAVYALLSWPLIMLLNKIDDAISNRKQTRLELMWEATGLRLGFVILGIILLGYAIACLVISLSLIFPALSLIVFAATSFIIAKSPKNSQYILGRTSGITKKKLVLGAVGIFVLLVIISNM